MLILQIKLYKLHFICTKTQKNNGLINANNREGKYAIEVWKYNPKTLVEDVFNENSVVDPLSLYLSLKDNQDERIEMALEQIIEKYICQNENYKSFIYKYF